MEMTTKVSARAETPAPQPQVAPAKHVHLRGIREVITGRDDNGRRIIAAIQDPEPSYVAGCKGCQAADQARMAGPPISAEAFDVTMFLIPEPEYDGLVARAYLQQRYPEATNVVHQFSAEKISYVRGAQIVVITRRAKPGKPLGPKWKRSKDEEGTFYDALIPPETHIDEIVESDPVIVADHIQVTPGTMYSEHSADFAALVTRLSERAVPYRIAPPNPPDKLFVMRLNS
jgi:hypothetical protein